MQRKQHNDARKSYQSSEYQRARKRQLAQYPWCYLDTAPTPCHGGLTVHHVNHDDTDQRHTNLATACKHHHMRLEAEYRRGDAHTGAMHAALQATLDAISRHPPTRG